MKLSKRSKKLFLFILVSSLTCLFIKPISSLVKTQYSAYQLEVQEFELAKNEFNLDLKKNQLKFFTFGFDINELSNKYLSLAYELDVYHAGCTMDRLLNQYNKMVVDHLCLERNLNIEDFWMNKEAYALAQKDTSRMEMKLYTGNLLKNP